MGEDMAYLLNRQLRDQAWERALQEGRVNPVYGPKFEEWHPEDGLPNASGSVGEKNAAIREAERLYIREHGGPTPNYPYSSPKVVDKPE